MLGVVTFAPSDARGRASASVGNPWCSPTTDRPTAGVHRRFPPGRAKAFDADDAEVPAQGAAALGCVWPLFHIEHRAAVSSRGRRGCGRVEGRPVLARTPPFGAHRLPRVPAGGGHGQFDAYIEAPVVEQVVGGANGPRDPAGSITGVEGQAQVGSLRLRSRRCKQRPSR